MQSPTTTTIGTCVLVLAIAEAGALLWLWHERRRMRDRWSSAQHVAEELRDGLQRKELMRQSERQGRVTAEKELRRLLDEKLDVSNGQYVQSLGIVHSCFQTCVGTPRQGLFAPSTRARIAFKRSISPDTLVGLEDFTHLWILFVFHKNTNGKNMWAHDGLRADSHRFTFKAKIAPPRLKERVGIFSTRSPHRPNPIGITLARIEAVDHKSRIVHLSAVDLVDGTPVLDIKPYVPAYDSVPNAKVAHWVSSDLSPTIHQVRWSDSAIFSKLHTLAERSQFYKHTPELLQAAIEEVLLVDVRSRDLTKRRQQADSELVLDVVRVVYRVNGEEVVTVIDVASAD